MKIRLDEWLIREFDPPRAIRTARIWAKTGKIYPAPCELPGKPARAAAGLLRLA